MFKNLFTRMLIIYLAAVFALLALLGITVSTMFQNRYTGAKEAELFEAVAALNQIIVDKYFDENTRMLVESELEITARKYDALISLYFVNAPMERVDFAAKDVWGDYKNVDLSANIAEATGKSEAVHFKYNILDETVSIPYMTVAMSFNVPASNVQGVTFIHSSTEFMQSSLKQVRLNLLLSAFVAILLAVLAVSYLTSRITRPIIDMNNTVKRFTKGQFTARVKISGMDEVAQLARSFNAMADELDSLEQVRKSFVANVSHELRSPLTSMRGFLEAMQDGTIPPDEYGKYLEIVISETNRMTALVNDLLDLARIESGQVKLNIETFDINELIIRTLITFEARINAKNLDVEVDFDEEKVMVEADSGQIAQVLRNLIDNALKYSPDGAKLVLASRAGKRQTTVSVRDYGKGMSREDRKYVFDRFYKVDKAHTPTGGTGGTGLGLSIVKRIIDQHGQAIAVDCPKGGGTRFIFTLKRSVQKHRGLI